MIDASIQVADWLNIALADASGSALAIPKTEK